MPTERPLGAWQFTASNFRLWPIPTKAKSPKKPSESFELHQSPCASRSFQLTCEIELPSGKAHCRGLQTIFAPIF
jgi:hypothetical protein